MKAEDAPTRFWRMVNKTETCWLWTGCANRKGYGQFRPTPKRCEGAHRYSWALSHGPIQPGLYVDHICHVRNCVNPEHLRLVTPKQNMENKATTDHGIHFYRRTGKWQAYVTHYGHRHNIGTFNTRDAAIRAVRLKRVELYTHNDLDREALAG